MDAPSNPPLVARIVAACCRRAVLVTAVALLAAVGSAVYVAKNFAMTTDTAALISSKASWKRTQAIFDRAFPGQGDQIAVVIDGRTPEIAEESAARLTAALQPRHDVFRSVRRPDGGPFFDRVGLLFSSRDDVKKATGQLIAAQPFLGPLAADPSLRGLITSLNAAMLGVQQGQAKLSDVDRPIRGVAEALDQVAEGRPAFFSWRTLISGGKADPRELRRFITILPKLDYSQLMPGQKATDAVRQAARTLQLTTSNGVTVRLTGSVPLSDEEFGSLQDGAGVIGVVMFLATLAMLWLAVRSARIIACIVVTVGVGLVVTAAFGLGVYHRYNLISVAFIALFVGLGVDFAIQFSVRYTAERISHPDLADALAWAGRRVGTSLALAAAATGIGFFAFLPTNYIGVSELGLIAGVGMLVAFLLSVTLLPALLTLARPKGEREEVGFTRLAGADRFIARNRLRILRASGGVALACLLLTPFIHFDFDPINLKSSRTESVATLRDLSKSAATSPNTLNVLRPSVAAATSVAKRLSALPEVDKSVTLAGFVPEDQPAKLAILADANTLLDPTLNPFEVAPPPTDAELVTSLRSGAQALNAAANTDRTSAGADARRLARLFTRLAGWTPDLRARAQAVLMSGLPTLLRQLRTALTAGPVTLATLPADLRGDWVSKDGQARVQVFPKGDANDPRVLRRFVNAVQAVDPETTGAPISIRGSGRTIIFAFAEAAVLSMIAIVALLFFVLRRPRDVALTLAPVILTGLLTVASCVVIGQPINFENVIALPLLLGIGVAFNIYFVMAWRRGEGNLMESPLTRAVLFSALTTAAAFGSLCLSPHPGTSSMGRLLMISLGWTLLVALVFEPTLLGPPRRSAGRPAGA